MREPVLVASIDGVGTKLKIAFAMDKHDTVGRGSGESLRQRHRCTRRASAVLPRLHRLRKTGAPRVPAITSRTFSRLSSRGLRTAGRRDRANARNVSQGRIRSRRLHRWGRGSNEESSTAVTSNRATSFSVSLQLVYTRTAIHSREKFCSTRCDSKSTSRSTRIDNHGRRRTAARA